MARTIALKIEHLRDSRLELLRSSIVIGCALALIASGQFYPF